MIRFVLRSASVFLALSLVVSAAVAGEDAGPVQARLDELKAQGEAQVPPGLLEAGRQGAEELEESGILQRALKTGAKMPEFTLEDAHGVQVSSADLLAEGPLVVIFYRGAWCPYCNVYLSSVQEYLPQIRARGASVVAISGERPDRSLAVAQKNALGFTVLSDPELTAARDFGIAYELPAVVDEAITAVGFDMAGYFGTEKAELALGATYVVDRDGTVLYDFLTVDYKVRAEPDDFLAVLPEAAGAGN